MTESTRPPTTPTAKRAFRSPRSWTILLSILMVGLVVDLGSKVWAFRTIAQYPVELDRTELLSNTAANPIPPHPGKHVLPWSLLDVRLVINRGAVFGIGADHRVFFIAFTMMALAAGLVVFGRYTTSRSTFAHIAIGLILAGGLGNLYDRIVYGVVRDFLHMLPGVHLPFGFTWPGGNPELFPWVFNIADVMLLSGMLLLMIYINKSEKKREAREAEGSTTPAE